MSENKPSCFGQDDCSTMALASCPVKDECEVEALRNDLKYYQQELDRSRSNLRYFEQELDKCRKLIDKFQTIVKHAQAERTGVYFISGGSEVEKDGLPMYIEVCPGFGSDASAMYRKITPLSAPEY